jgi:hypothetical protein
MENIYISDTKPNRLMLFSESVAVYCVDHTKHANILCAQNEAGGICNDHWAWKG